MRKESEIVKDIAYLKQDITQLRSISGSCAMALDDLEDLYAELRLAKQNGNGCLDNPMISLEEYEKLLKENEKLKQEIKDVKAKMVKRLNEYTLRIDKLINRTLWKRIMNKQIEE